MTSKLEAPTATVPICQPIPHPRGTKPLFEGSSNILNRAVFSGPSKFVPWNKSAAVVQPDLRKTLCSLNNAFLAKNAQNECEIPLPVNPLKRMTVCLHELSFWMVDGSKLAGSEAAKTHRYVLFRRLGSGTTGVVYAAYDKEEGKIVAVKMSKWEPIANPYPARIRKPAEKARLQGSLIASMSSWQGISKNRVYCQTVARELVMLQELQTVSEVVRCLDWFYSRPFQVALVLECLPVSVLQCISSPSSFNWTVGEAAHFIGKMGKFLCDLKEKKVIHGDLKPENIMLESLRSKDPKVVDFGSAKRLESHFVRYTDYITRWYRAPEVLLSVQDWKTEVDMWSLGCILFELATGEVLFPSREVELSTCKKQEILEISLKQGTFTEEAAILADYTQRQVVTDHLNFIARLLGPPPKNMFKKGTAKNDLFTINGSQVTFKMDPSEGAKKILAARQEQWRPFGSDQDLLRSRIKKVLSSAWPEQELYLFADLVRKMVSYRRISPEELLKHPFLKPFSQTALEEF